MESSLQRTRGNSAIGFWQTARRFSRHLRGRRWQLLAVVVLGICAALAECVGLGLFIPLIGSLSSAPAAGLTGLPAKLQTALTGWVRPEQRLFVLFGLIFAAILLKSILSYSNVVVIARLKAQVGHDLRSRIFHQLTSVAYSFLEKNDWSRLLDVLASETWRAMQALGYFISMLVNIGAVVVFGFLLASISVPVLLLIGGGLLITFAATQLLSRPVKRLGEDTLTANVKLGGWMLDGIAGMRVIHTFGLKRRMQSRFDESSNDVRRAFLRLDVLSGLTGPVAELLYAALLIGIVFAASQLHTPMPALVVAVLILYRVQPQLREIESARVNMVGLAAAVESVSALLDPTDKPWLSSGLRRIESLEDGIDLERVGFSYGTGGRAALENITFRIGKGQTTAIVGPSGAGKTTLLNLLCRLYDPTEGRILVDGVPLADFDIDSWRWRIAVAGQDVHLFNTSVRQNIGYGKLDATDEEIVAAARRANADQFIRDLPDGYETELGDRGARLSGGQRQRLSLARAFLRNPDILILDEATNALDGISEQAIQEAIDSFGASGTVIVVAHRLSTIRFADQILVLDHGRAVEQGSLPELLENNNLFAKLYSLQMIPTAS